MKQTIRLNESELHRIIKESVKRILKENFGDEYTDGNEWRLGHRVYTDKFRSKLRQLRNQIDNLESQGKDASEISNQIRILKHRRERQVHGIPDVGDFWYGFAVCWNSEEKANYMKEDGTYLFDDFIFDEAGHFNEYQGGRLYAPVAIGDNHYLITPNGERFIDHGYN